MRLKKIPTDRNLRHLLKRERARKWTLAHRLQAAAAERAALEKKLEEAIAQVGEKEAAVRKIVKGDAWREHCTEREMVTVSIQVDVRAAQDCPELWSHAIQDIRRKLSKKL